MDCLTLPPKLPHAGKAADGVAIEPVFILRTTDPAPRSQQAWAVRCQVHSYWDPPNKVGTLLYLSVFRVKDWIDMSPLLCDQHWVRSY